MPLTTFQHFQPHLANLAFTADRKLTPRDANRLSLALIELLSENHCDAHFLKWSSKLLTKQAYEEIVEERNINRWCGYPLCHQHQARVSYNNGVAKELMPYAYLHSYCSKTHYQSSEFFSTQLSDEALFSRDIQLHTDGDVTLLEEVLDEYGKRKEAQPHITLIDIVKSLDSLSLENKKDDTEQVMKMLEDIKIVEKDVEYDPEADVPNDDTSYEYLQDQSKAIDGYVLRI